MNLKNLFQKSLYSLLLLALPAISGAQVLETIAGSQVTAWASSGETVTVPDGTVYKLELPGGESIVINEGSQFKVIEEDGEIARVILLGGELVVDRLGNDGATVEIEIDGDVITSDGADLVVTADESGTSISHHTNKGSPEGDGTVLVNGEPIAPGTGGIIAEGSFVQDQPTEAKLDILSDQLLRRSGTGPRPPYERMKDLPESIVRENLNDLSPS